MHFVPILSTLRRHRTAATLIVLEIALTCAIVCNAIFLIGDRLSRMDKPSGIAEDEIVNVQLAGIGKGADADAITKQDFAALRALPGVKAVTNVNMLPFGGSSWNTDVSTKPSTAGVNVGMYMGSEGLIDALGLQLVAGRDFTADDFSDFKAVQAQTAHISAVIITKALAEREYGSDNPIGKPLYVWGPDQPATIVGVIDRIARPNDGNGIELTDFSMILPVRASFNIADNYVIRTSDVDGTLAAAEATLMKVDPARIILKKRPFAEIRQGYFKQDRSMAFLLVGVCVVLLVITALGIVGLASFWVQQRTRQIGIRRALGATRGDIVRYFQVENFILATAGIVVGMGLAYAINLWLMDSYHVSRLPAQFLPIGALLLWLLGQAAVLGPAMRAATIPPATATRSV